jgi:hypothetical protein
MFTLIGLGVAVGYVYSVVATLAPGILPPAFRNHGGGVPVYFEAAAVITVLVLIGQVLELKARGETGATHGNNPGLRNSTSIYGERTICPSGAKKAEGHVKRRVCPPHTRTSGDPVIASGSRDESPRESLCSERSPGT